MADFVREIKVERVFGAPVLDQFGKIVLTLVQGREIKVVWVLPIANLSFKLGRLCRRDFASWPFWHSGWLPPVGGFIARFVPGFLPVNPLPLPLTWPMRPHRLGKSAGLF